VRLSRLQSNTEDNGGPQVVAAQVKEKFGSLRCYTEEAGQVQRGTIDVASALSERICEIGGAPGRLESEKG
jgi:hypothetical protein